jgi:nicotinamide riboside kinase
VLIGPECTGKTSLALALAEQYGVPCAPEHAREYALRCGHSLTFDDVLPIARGQREGEDAAIAAATQQEKPLVLLDTDLVSTAVYSRHYYGDCPPRVEREARGRLAELYLLHHVDVEWVADGELRQQPERRGELFELFRRTLQDLGARVDDVLGDWDERQARAVAAIDALLAARAASPPPG